MSEAEAKGGAPVGVSAGAARVELAATKSAKARDEWPRDKSGKLIPNANGWTPPEYDGDPNLTRGGMRTGTVADFHVDYDDGNNVQALAPDPVTKD